MSSQERPRLTSLQNTRIAYISSAGVLHHTVLGRINKPDGRQPVASGSRIPRSTAVGFRTFVVDAPLLLSGNTRPLPLPMAPTTVIDLSKDDDDDDEPPRAPAAGQRKRPGRRGEPINLDSSSPEPPRPQQSHARPHDLNGKSRNAAPPLHKQSSEHAPSTRPSLTSKTTGIHAPDPKKRDRQHHAFGNHRNSAISNHEPATKQGELPRDSQPKTKSLLRPQTMSSRVPTSSDASARKRARESDTSHVNQGSPSKKPRSSESTRDYVLGGRHTLQGGAPRNKASKLVFDLTGSDSDRGPSSPKGPISQGAAGNLGGEQNTQRGAQGRAPAGASSATSSRPDQKKTGIYREAPGKTSTTGGDGHSTASKSSSESRITPLRESSLRQEAGVNMRQTRQQDSRRGSDLGQVSEIPESAPGTPNSSGKDSGKSRAPSVTSSVKAASKPSATLRTLELFNRGLNSGRASSLSNRSDRSPSLNGPNTPPIHGSAAPSTSKNSGAKASLLRSEGHSPTAKAKGPVVEPTKSPMLEVSSNSVRATEKTLPVTSLGQPHQTVKPPKFPLSPSDTSVEDDGRAGTNVPPKRQSQKTPEKGVASRLEIPDSATGSTNKRPEVVVQSTASPQSKTHKAAIVRNSAPRQSDSEVSNRTPRKQDNPATTQGASQSPAFAARPALRPSADQQRNEAEFFKVRRPVQSSVANSLKPSAHQSSGANALKPSTPQSSATNALKPSAPQPASAATVNSASLKTRLNSSTSVQIEGIVGGFVEELRSDNEFWIQLMLKKARHTAEDKKPDQDKPTDVFAKLRPLDLSKPKAKTLKDHAKFGVELHTLKKTKTQWLAPCTVYDTSADDVPNYSQYVSIRNNFLAHNDTTLQHWPYFGDEFSMGDAEGLSMQYNLDVQPRERKLLSLAKAENLASYTEDMLEQVGCQWADVLYFLLDLLPDVGSDMDAKIALARRDSLIEDFVRKSPRWTFVLSKLPKVDPEKAGRAAILCELFQKLTHLKLWHVARLSGYLRGLLTDTEDPDGLTADQQLACRVCMRFNCPNHGEMRETPDGEEPEQSDPEMQPDETDIVHPPNKNYRKRVTFPGPVSNEHVQVHVPNVPKERRALRYWQTGNNASLLFKPDERGPFYPCHHPGELCSTVKCDCWEQRLPCEKSCSCPANCPRKFQGCNCASRPGKKGTRMVCFETDECACFQLGRECDPDLCGDCGVCDVLDPVHRHDDRILNGNCRNANIQRGVPKHTILGDSGVHGLGLYACENIRDHDFLGEYKGEIVTKEEAERRGAVYEHQKLSYLFSLNAAQEIDSTHFGNKIRFINHANKSQVNLYPRIQLVNTVHRIALYGARSIKAGEELFFDYGPMFPDDQLGGKTGKKTQQGQGQSKAAPHVRNSNLTKDFYDIIESKDEVGNLRARKAMGENGGKLRANKTARGTGRASHADVEMEDAPPLTIYAAGTVVEEDEDGGVEEEEPYSYDLEKYNVVDDAAAEREPSEDDDFVMEEDEEEFEEEREGRRRSRRRRVPQYTR